MKKENYLFKAILLYTTIITVIITLFSQFDKMCLIPLTTPSEFLGNQPSIVIGNLIMTQPSSTLIVYALGIFIILLGFRFLRIHNGYLSRKWWGYSMIFWGIGTILAGTSYQAFGYQLKCVGNEYCNFTDWWEVIYLLFTGTSIGMMGIGMSYAIVKDKARIIMQGSSIALMFIYGTVLVIGSVLPVMTLVTYELFNLIFMPLFIAFFIINIINYRRDNDELNRRFINGWLLFIVVNVSYYVYYWFGLSEMLFDSTGIWFNQNDILHVLVGLWMWYIWKYITNVIKDI